MLRINKFFTLFLLAALLIGACQPVLLDSTEMDLETFMVPDFEASECKYPIPEGDRVECGYLTVREDRSDADSPTIRLHVVNFKSQADESKPVPIFMGKKTI